MINSIRPRKFGVIIRTVAQNKKVAELDQDLRDLEKKWAKMYKELRNASPRKKLLGEMNRATTCVSPRFLSSLINLILYHWLKQI